MSNKEQSKSKEYNNVELQKLFLNFLISEATLFTRVYSIIKPEYFHQSLKKTARYILDFSNKYNALPKPEQIKAETGFDLVIIPNISINDTEWFLDHIEAFCKHRAMELWLIDGPDLVSAGEYGSLEGGLKEALLISLNKEIGTEYFKDPKGRLLKLKESNGQVKTPWKELNELLYGGFNRGELNIFEGLPNAGKSLFLQNIALYWALEGMLVVYISLEMSEALISMRLDAMITGYPTKEIFKKIDEVDLKVRAKGRSAGEIIVKQMPTGTTPNQIKSFLKEIEIKLDQRPDALIVDYLDLLHPDTKVNLSDHFTKDKYSSEELRSLANQGLAPGHNLLLVTAGQINRSGVDEVEFDFSNTAGGISKINTADNIFAIFTSRIMREKGQYQLQLLKTRSSAGVGKKINLAFNIESMLITDLDDDYVDIDQSDTYNKLKEKNKTTISKSKENKFDILEIVKKMNNS